MEEDDAGALYRSNKSRGHGRAVSNGSMLEKKNIRLFEDEKELSLLSYEDGGSGRKDTAAYRMSLFAD